LAATPLRPVQLKGRGYTTCTSLMTLMWFRCHIPHLTPTQFNGTLSFYEEILGGRGYVTVLSTDTLQAPLDRARGELPSDTRTLIFHYKTIRGKISEIWRLDIAN
ncbi:MAG: hypothetical protein MJE68_04695, partial [Proteobacteria bacterium]|nr:hypothetical protein [Pseudomonadota bacterium]